MVNKSNRMRRFLAYVIDLSIAYLPCCFTAVALLFPSLGILVIVFALIAYFASLVVFIMRDYLFDGASIGKRIMKLRVVDAYTLSKPSAEQLIYRGFFLFLYLLDGLFLIVSGRSLGERATHTVVLQERQLASAVPYDRPTPSKKTTKKHVYWVVAVVLAFFIILFLIISIALNSVKKQENYRIAYSYLTSSDAYVEIQADESQIKLTGYSSSTKLDGSGNPESTVATFTFFVQGRQYQVVCHKDGDTWYVCNECTAFQ